MKVELNFHSPLKLEVKPLQFVKNSRRHSVSIELKNNRTQNECLKHPVGYNQAMDGARTLA